MKKKGEDYFNEVLLASSKALEAGKGNEASGRPADSPFMPGTGSKSKRSAPEDKDLVAFEAFFDQSKIYIAVLAYIGSQAVSLVLMKVSCAAHR